jgi:hypothetical protein
MLAGVNELVQEGAPKFSVTVAVHVAVVPAPFCAVSVQVCVDVGDFTEEPLAPTNVPLPKLPVQTKGICASASFVDVHEMVEVPPAVTTVGGANEAEQVGGL